MAHSRHLNFSNDGFCSCVVVFIRSCPCPLCVLRWRCTYLIQIIQVVLHARGRTRALCAARWPGIVLDPSGFSRCATSSVLFSLFPSVVTAWTHRTAMELSGKDFGTSAPLPAVWSNDQPQLLQPSGMLAEHMQGGWEGWDYPLKTGMEKVIFEQICAKCETQCLMSLLTLQVTAGHVARGCYPVFLGATTLGASTSDASASPHTISHLPLPSEAMM
jgi:hypothetical protein